MLPLCLMDSLTTPATSPPAAPIAAAATIPPDPTSAVRMAVFTANAAAPPAAISVL